MLNEEHLWFEQYLDRGDALQIALWIRERNLLEVSEDDLIAIVEAGWKLQAERLHRAARRYISRAESEGYLIEEDHDGVKYYSVKSEGV
jgi:hypothetical protein